MGETDGGNGATPADPTSERSTDRPVVAAAATPTQTLPFSIDAAAAPVDGNFGPGAELGRYRIRHVVGAGGIGVVLAAHDPELGRSVAIKLLAREHEEARTRLLREAQAMAKLSHPNVVTVHEVIRVGDRAAIVMELVDGQDLASWLAESPRGWRAIVAAYVQAARGLAAAHRAGLVHRDFKPSNALIDRDGVVRVTDFGLVRAATGDPEPVAERLAARDQPELGLTRTGALLGTPAYMAPEQHRGEPVEARTDQWALACALYGALFDQRPFAGDTYVELSAAVLDGKLRPEPKDTRVPRRIRAAIRRALSRDPRDRFATMDDLIVALTPPSRAWLAAGVGGGVAIAAAITAVAVARNQGAVTCEDLDAPFAAAWNAERARALRDRFAAASVSYAGAVADRVIASLDRYRTGWVAMRTRACTQARQGVGSDDLLDRRMRCLDRRLVEVDTLVAGLLEADAPLIQRAGGAVEGLYPVADCEDPADTVPRPADPAARVAIARGEDDVSRAWALGELGRFDQGRSLSESAVEVAERTGWPPLAARALLQLGRSQSRNLEGTAALASFDRAATAAAHARDDKLLAEALVARFFTLADALGRPADALAGRQFVELAIARAGSPDRIQATWLHHLAAAMFLDRKYQEALDTQLQAEALWRTLVEPGNVALRDCKANEAVFRTWLGQLDEAAALLDHILATDTAQLGPDHPELAGTLINLGELEMRRGHHRVAIEHWERAVAIEKAAGVTDWMAMSDLGMGHFNLGRWSAAVGPLTDAVAAAEASAIGESANVGYAATALGAALVALGELDRARPVLERALAAARGSSSPGLVDTLGQLALHALAGGDVAAARQLATEAGAAEGEPAPAAALAEAELARLANDCKTAGTAYDRAIEIGRQHAEEWAITDATAGKAECQLRAGAAREALTALEARLAWLEPHAPDPGAAARVRFALARALVATGGDRGRARTLAESARAGFATIGAPGARRAAEVARWLAGH